LPIIVSVEVISIVFLHAAAANDVASMPVRRQSQMALSQFLTPASTPRTIPVIRPVVGSIGGFIAVIPAEPSAELIRLAADCLSEFDPFRAPLTSEDRARRSPSELTPGQREHLDLWGYPYVMEDFRFHMTLTGRLPAERREPILQMLRNSFSAIDPKTLAIDGLAVFRQHNVNCRFRIVADWQLRTADILDPKP
jgi:uncharacterized protein DUF1045